MRWRPACGFTLLEMLVALAVLAALALISFRGLGAILRAEVSVDSDLRRWNEVAAVFEQIGRDLSLAVDRPVRDADARVRPAFMLGATELVLTRLGDAQGASAQISLRRVGYRLADSTLERLVWSAPDAAPGSAPEALAVLGGVSEMRLRALDRNGAWFPHWTTGAQAALPAAVEIQLVLASGERVTRLFALR